MILYPAIDLKGGACVRLVRGEMATATVFNVDPAAQARQFAEIGFAWLHVVDLDGSFAGESRNGEAVRMIRRAVPDMRMQLGGGIRDRAAIHRWLDLGIDRVALGTAALREPELVRQAAADYPGHIIVDIGVRNGKVAVQGWGEVTEIAPLEVARRFTGSGISAIVYTDVGRDGAMGGVDAAAIAAFARAAELPVIASGGIASLADIAALRAHAGDGIVGAICGRALYDGRVDAAAALRVAAGEGAPC
jgi:phosphoribosylformimino-5-aminoimidazole carboxamide ribotide isomerase